MTQKLRLCISCSHKIYPVLFKRSFGVLIKNSSQNNQSSSQQKECLKLNPCLIVTMTVLNYSEKETSHLILKLEERRKDSKVILEEFKKKFSGQPIIKFGSCTDSFSSQRIIFVRISMLLYENKST